MGISLYTLFPAVIQSEDSTASAGQDETLLQKIVYVLEQESDIFIEKTKGLKDLIDVDKCSSDYFPFLYGLFGFSVDPSWDEDKRRDFLRDIVYLIKISGQRKSWKYLLNRYGYTGAWPWELYKSELNEKFDYSAYLDYGRMLSARVDLSKVLEESDTESHPSEGYDPYTYTETEDILDIFEKVRPIHILIRSHGLSFEITEETPIFSIADSAEGKVIGEVEDAVGTLAEDLTIEVTCQWGGCQIDCEVSCETDCEADCEAACITGCENWCEVNCQLFCEFACQTDCQGTCEGATCQLSEQ